MTDTPSAVSFSDEIDARQEAVLAQLEQLNDRIELVLLEMLRERKQQVTPSFPNVAIEGSDPVEQHVRAA